MSVRGATAALSRRSDVSLPAWLLFLAAACGAGALIMIAPESVQVRTYEGVSFAGALAVGIGVYRHRPPRAAAWWLLALGMEVVAIGDLIFGLYPVVTDQPAPFPSLADPLWLGGYMCIGLGVWLLLRRKGPGAWKQGLVDALIAAAALLAALWIVFLGPELVRGGFPPRDAIIVAYPLIDILLVALTFRFLFTPGEWTPALRLLAIGTWGLAYGDLLYTVPLAAGSTVPSWAVSAGWLLAPVAFGALALHPSMRSLVTEPVRATRGGVPRARILMMAGVTVTPGIAWVQARLLGLPVTGDALALQAAVAALMVVRMAGLLRTADDQRRELARRDAERRRFLERLTIVAEEERGRISRELHDGPIQHLAGIELGLERVQMRLRDGDVEHAAAVAGTLQEHLREEVVGLRRLMVDLHPPILTERGLPAALKDHVEALGHRTDLQVTMRAGLDRRLDADAETVLFRVAQESLSNVVQHARAGRVWVSVQRLDEQVELAVRDDGWGFEPEAVAASMDRFGLASMRERVEMAGGTLEVRSRPGSGTLVRACLPVGREEAT